MTHRGESEWRLVSRRAWPLVFALLGIGCVAALLYVEWPHVTRRLVEEDERRALTTPDGQIWLATLLGQGALWAVLGAIVVPAVWRLRRRRPSVAALVFGVIVIGLLVVIGLLLARFGPQPDYPLVGHGWKLIVMTSVGSLIAFLALIMGWAAVGEADRALVRIGQVEPAARRAALAAHVAERARDTTVIEWYLGLRETLTRSLGVQGAILAAAVLATGARQNALESVGVKVPFEHTVEYGLVLSALIGVLYLPCHQRLSELGAAIREQLRPPPAADDPDLLEAYDQRSALGKLLQLNITAVTAFRAPLAILAPLASGVIAELLK
jgi:hypothetical protein